jgi:hypothetical protein
MHESPPKIANEFAIGQHPARGPPERGEAHLQLSGKPHVEHAADGAVVVDPLVNLLRIEVLAMVSTIRRASIIVILFS